MKNGNFAIIKRSQVQRYKTVLPAVWQMKKKRDIKTRKVKKWKARLNLDGSKQKDGRDYKETFAPVVSWESVRLLLTLVLKNG